MILPAVRERLEALLRHAAMEGALAVLRSGANHISITGLHDVAKALVAAYLTHALRRPAFFVTDSNRRAEALAETLRFFSNIFPGATGGVATLPAFDRLPWESQSPHADILERRAATLFRVADGQVSFVIAPIAAALWRYQDPAAYLYLTRTLAPPANPAQARCLSWQKVRSAQSSSSMSHNLFVKPQRSIWPLRRKITSVTAAPTHPPPLIIFGLKSNLPPLSKKRRKFTSNSSLWRLVPRRSLSFPLGPAPVFTAMSLPAWETSNPSSHPAEPFS